MKILVTGATGYVGGQLIPRLLEQGHEIVALARHPEYLAGRPWSDQIKVVQADLLEALWISWGQEQRSVAESVGLGRDIQGVSSDLTPVGYSADARIECKKLTRKGSNLEFFSDIRCCARPGRGCRIRH